jgi:hypothetical protein
MSRLESKPVQLHGKSLKPAVGMQDSALADDNVNSIAKTSEKLLISHQLYALLRQLNHNLSLLQRCSVDFASS